ncbi:hypothetical protein DL95DRAFT_488166 [Leptodontidium sp. 2 PMI_412]|nr:hypothetical protein DL95DRAFT_488166 [Leptodontidium sp. 2 PMI_412]
MIIEAKVGIGANFSIFKPIIIHISIAGFIVLKVRPPPLLLLCVDQLCGPTPRGEEEKQDQCELHAMLLCRERRSIACLVVVEQEQEVVDTKDRLLLDGDIEIHPWVRLRIKDRRSYRENLFCIISIHMAAILSIEERLEPQVIRHDPQTGVFNGSYINHQVRFNVQDAFLKSDISDDGLTRAFAHLSIRCNSGAPRDVPPEVMDPLLAANPDLVDLERQRKALRTKMKWEYKCIKRAPRGIKIEYDDLGKQLTNAKKSLKDEIKIEYRKDYFFRVHNEMTKMQLQRRLNKEVVVEDEVEPLVERQLEERTQLQRTICDFSKGLSPEAVVARKVSTIDLMIALASRQELQTHQPRSAPAHKGPLKDKSPIPAPPLGPSPPSNEFPLVCEKT